MSPSWSVPLAGGVTRVKQEALAVAGAGFYLAAAPKSLAASVLDTTLRRPPSI